MHPPANALQRYRASFVQRDLVAELEGLSARALPPLETLEVDGWRLRSARGFTKRANSVWPRRGTGRLPLDRKLDHVERFYRVRRLPVCYQLSPSSDPGDLDRRLAGRGYRTVAPTQVLAGRLDRLARLSGGEVQLLDTAGGRWLDRWAELGEHGGRAVEAAAAVFARVPAASAYAVARVGGVDVAVARGVVDGGWLGLFDVHTDVAHRRTGAARALLGALGLWAAGLGAERAWLQVEEDNAPAQALCSGLGLRLAFGYRYRMSP